MKAYNIDWDVDMDEVYEKLDNMFFAKAAKELEIPCGQYASMTTEERYDYIDDYYHHRPGAIDDLLGLPTEVDIPDDIEEDEVVEWLEDEYGYCINGLKIE